MLIQVNFPIGSHLNSTTSEVREVPCTNPSRGGLLWRRFVFKDWCGSCDKNFQICLTWGDFVWNNGKWKGICLEASPLYSQCCSRMLLCLEIFRIEFSADRLLCVMCLSRYKTFLLPGFIYARDLWLGFDITESSSIISKKIKRQIYKHTQDYNMLYRPTSNNILNR